MILDIYNREIEEGDIIVRPIFSNLRVSKVLKITETSITLSQHKEVIHGYKRTTNNVDVSNHNSKRILYERDFPAFLILKKRT